MHTTIEFSIPVPCHEKWNSMTPNEQGRFCANCQKSVVDFTSMTEQELILYFKYGAEQTCGRFRSDQLNREMLLEQPEKLKWFKYFLQIFLPTMLFAGKAYAQGKVKSTQSHEKVMLNQKEYLTMGEPVMIKGDTTFCVKPYQEKPKVEAVHRGTAVARKILSKPVHYTEPLSSSLRVKPEVTRLHPLSNHNDQIENFPNELWMATNHEGIFAGGISITRTRVTATQRAKKMVIDSLKYVFSSSTCTIRIHPNPVSSSVPLNIEIAARYPGEYTLAIVDMNGINMQREHLNIQSKSIQRQIVLSQSIISGSYVLQLFGPDGKIVSTQKLIVGK